MRRRLVTSTLAIALLSVIVLGVPLLVLARNEVTSSAREKVTQQAQIVAAGLEDRLDARQPVTAARLAQLLPSTRVVVTTAQGQTVVSGAAVSGPVVRVRTALAGATITVEKSRGSTTAAAWKVTALVIGLGLAAIASAVALALRQARRLANPLRELADHAAAFGHGDFTRPMVRAGVPEIDEISGVLERSARQVGGLIDMQRDFASDAAHQLRTPLTGVGLRLEEIAYLSDGAVRDEAEAALAQVERLDLVITGLLARARGDSSPPGLIDLAALVHEECESWDRVLATRGRHLNLRTSAPVIVLARRGHLTSILTTLLDNALVHGAGAITVAVETAQDDAVLRVADDGAGVPDELRARVFERAVSGNRGTGIGLALARSLAEAEGARLELSAGGREFVLSMTRAHPRRATA